MNVSASSGPDRRARSVTRSTMSRTHLILSASGAPAATPADVALRIDAGLFRTLSIIFEGLPRHLVNPGELNRLDTFVDRLRGLTPSPLPEFLIYNAEHVASGAVKMSTALDRYLEARRL